jgi:uncharacterized membrane protein YedE/YeeE
MSGDIVSALAGGLLIGAAAVLMMLVSGRIMGVSGILGGALLEKTDRAWRLLFLFGVLAGVVLIHALFGKPLPPLPAGGSGLAIVAGLLVGFGTRLGSGCTSGHGVCGISRLSPRSLAATVIFMLAGMVTVYLARQIMG